MIIMITIHVMQRESQWRSKGTLWLWVR